MADDNESKSSGAVWDRLDQQSGLIGELARNQAALEANVAALAESVRSGFNNVNSSIAGFTKDQRAQEQRFVEQQSRPFPIWNLVSAVAATAVLIGGYATIIAKPIETAAIYNASQIDELQRHRQRTAALEAQMEIVLLELRRLEDFRAEAHFLHGQSAELSERVEDIDTHGSRRWNNDARTKK